MSPVPILPMICRQEGVGTVLFAVSNVLFEAGGETVHGASLRGLDEVRAVLQSLIRGGVTTAVWNDGPPASAALLRSLIEREYPEFSGRILHQYDATDAEVLLVTGDLAQWSHAVRAGVRTCFHRLFEGEEGPNPLRISLLKALGASEDGDEILADPVGYLRRLKDVAEVVRQSGIEDKSFKRFLEYFDAKDKPSALTAELKAAAVDWLVWTGNDSLPPLASSLQDLPIDPDLLPLPRYKSHDRMRREFARFFEDGWRRIDAFPALPALPTLIDEMDRIITFVANHSETSSELAALSWKIFQDRFSSSREHLVNRLGLMSEEDWEALAAAFREDDAALDARHAEWITGVLKSVRRMVSSGKSDAEISAFVCESLQDGLFFRILMMEMDMRELRAKGRPFLHRHDMRNLGSALVMNRHLIEGGRASWSTYARLGSIREWIEAMLFPLIGLASPRNVHLEIAFNRGGKAPWTPLTVFSEAERDALGHVLSELVRNGIKYRDPGATRSQVSVRVKENEGGLEIVVSDNGVGIRDTERVWERGIRERPDLADGDGDGLPSIMRHVSRWQWRINIDSKVGEGCTFTLAVPFPAPSP